VARDGGTVGVNILAVDTAIMGPGAASAGNAPTVVANAVSVAKAASVAKVVTTAIARKRAADGTAATAVASEVAIKIGASAPESVVLSKMRRATAATGVAEMEIAAREAGVMVVAVM